MGEGELVSLALQCRGCGSIMSRAATSCTETRGMCDRNLQTWGEYGVEMGLSSC